MGIYKIELEVNRKVWCGTTSPHHIKDNGIKPLLSDWRKPFPKEQCKLHMDPY